VADTFERDAEPAADLEAMIGALRTVTEPAPHQVDGTRRRVLASFEHRATGRRRRVAVIVTALTLGTGTLSWAATTGRLAPVLARLGWQPAGPAAIEPEHGPRLARPHAARVASTSVATAPTVEAGPNPSPSPSPTPNPIPNPSPTLIPSPSPTLIPSPSPSPTPTPTLLPTPTPTLTARVAAAPRRPHARSLPAVVDDDRADFRRADQLQVRGDDATATLAAWDAYLAAHPTGTLAVEARYNRALTLVRLRRWADARAALAPFVDATVAPRGYRQAEASALADAIARRDLAAGGTP